jgi:hypothetical protein
MSIIEMHIAECLALTGNVVLEVVKALRYYL